MKLERVSNEPILEPRENVLWERDAVFNPAIIYEDNTFHLFYRATVHLEGDHNKSSIGHAVSEDGVHFERFDKPILSYDETDYDFAGVEDPRITKIGDTYYIVYNCYTKVYPPKVGMASSKDLYNWQREGVIIGPEQFGPTKDTGLFPEKINGKYAIVHRPGKKGTHMDFTNAGMEIAFSDDLYNWYGSTLVMSAGSQDWESHKVGWNIPPIKTEKGWLMVYHGVDEDSVYRLGILLLDLNDPTVVKKKQDEPVLEPELEWELHGDVPNVVFACGAVLIENELWVYYGGADKVVGVAKGDVREFLQD
mgnify:CR=1 FL=1